jgi:two-component system CheB/CheR fusion protein
MILRDPEALSLPLTIPFRRGTEAWHFLRDFRAMLDQLEQNRRFLREARDGMEDSLREKEALLREIHHRVKNNLQIVSSLLSLQENAAADDSVKAVLRESGSRIRAMALVHELIYASDTLQSVNLADYLREIVSSLFRMYAPPDGKISLSFDTEPVRVGLDSAILVGLIATELTTNSLNTRFRPIGEGRS